MPHPDWRQAKSPEGKTYYFNKLTKASVWIRPDDADAIAEADMSAALSDVNLLPHFFFLL